MLIFLNYYYPSLLHISSTCTRIQGSDLQQRPPRRWFVQFCVSGGSCLHIPAAAHARSEYTLAIKNIAGQIFKNRYVIEFYYISAVRFLLAATCFIVHFCIDLNVSETVLIVYKSVPDTQGIASQTELLLLNHQRSDFSISEIRIFFFSLRDFMKNQRT